jgi:hypothetical protein
MDPFQIHYFSKNLAAPGIVPEAPGCVVWNSDHQATESVSDINYVIHGRI